MFTTICLIELVLKILAVGYTKYFTTTRYWMEALSLGATLLLLSVHSVMDHVVVYRLFNLLRLHYIIYVGAVPPVTKYFKKILFKSMLLRKLRIVLENLYASIIVGGKMFPLFMTVYYILGIIGI